MPVKSYFRYIKLVILSLLLFPGCNPPGCSEKMQEEYPEEFAGFFHAPLKLQRLEFQKSPIERQFKLYMYGMLRMHHPRSSFADEFVKAQGEKAIPFLTDKLKQEKDESRQYAIIYIFEVMAECNYNITDNKELMELIRKDVSLMRYPANVDPAKEALARIIRQGIENSMILSAPVPKK